MRALVLVLIMLVACDDAAPVCPADSGIVLVVYPCSIQDDTCRAAFTSASAFCDGRYRCGALTCEGDRDGCIADEMERLCTQVTCYADGDYQRWPELNACIEARSTTCADNGCDLAVQ